MDPLPEKTLMHALGLLHALASSVSLLRYGRLECDTILLYKFLSQSPDTHLYLLLQ